MKANKAYQEENLNEEIESSSVKGTIFSVSIVGLVILITYFVLFGLFMDRV